MIELLGGYRLNNSKPPEITLQCEREVKVMKNLKPTGETRLEWTDVGYFTSLKSAMNSFLNHYASRANSIEEVATRIDEVASLITKAFSLDWVVTVEKKPLQVSVPVTKKKSVIASAAAMKAISVMDDSMPVESAMSEEDSKEAATIKKLTTGAEDVHPADNSL